MNMTPQTPEGWRFVRIQPCPDGTFAVRTHFLANPLGKAFAIQVMLDPGFRSEGLTLPEAMEAGARAERRMREIEPRSRHKGGL